MRVLKQPAGRSVGAWISVTARDRDIGAGRRLGRRRERERKEKRRSDAEQESKSVHWYSPLGLLTAVLSPRYCNVIVVIVPEVGVPLPRTVLLPRVLKTPVPD